MIKLKDLLLEQKLIEAVDIPPVKFVEPPAHIAYVDGASAVSRDDDMNKAMEPYKQRNIDFSGIGATEGLVVKATNIIKHFENSHNNPRGGYNKSNKLWYPHKSIEGGAGTIAYGHKIKPDENFSEGINEQEAERLLDGDINDKISVAKRHMKNFDQFPIPVKVAAVNALFRGDIGKETMNLLASHKFDAAAKNYLNDKNYRSASGKSGIKKRMDWNAAAFRMAGGLDPNVADIPSKNKADSRTE